MDDFLIICSYIMIIPLVVLAWPWLRSITEFDSLSDFFLTAPAVLAPRLSAIILYGAGAVSSQVIGRIIRFQEKQSLDILDTLQFYKNTTIPKLSSQLGMAESKISALLKKMSRISSLGIRIEGEQVSIGQIIETPSSPQESSTEDFKDFDLGFQEAIKKAAESGRDMTDDQKKEEFKKIAQSFMGKGIASDGKGKKFNIALFIILFLTPLWPVALVYAISFALKQQKAVMADKNNSQSS
ncbi:MAG: hypothetical protein JEY91_07410 [Spirochaetaceae bacterium]|nr:hypothetical protein [Spirochaetaceae bacterium]